jgi:hypothetical protein
MSVLCKPESHSSCPFHKLLFLILYIVPVETVLLFSISSFSLLHAEQTQQRAMFPISNTPRSLTIVVIVPHCHNPPLRLQLRSPPRCLFQPMLVEILSQPIHIFRTVNCGFLSISSCSYRSVTEFPREWHSCIN